MNFLNIRPDIKNLQFLAFGFMTMWGLTANPAYLVGFPLFFTLLGFGIIQEAIDARATGVVFNPIKKLLTGTWWILGQIHIAVLVMAIWIFLKGFESKDVWFQSGLNMSLAVGNIAQSQRPENYFSPDSLLSPFVHMWSLSIALQYLLLLIVLGFVISIIHIDLPTMLKRGLVLALYLISGYLAFITPFEISKESFLSTQSWAWTFLFGVALAFTKVRIPESKINAFAGDLMFLGVLAIVGLHVYGMNFASTYIPYLMCLLVVIPIAFSKNETLNFRLLSTTYIDRIAYISFGVFIWHWPIAQFVKNQFSLEVLPASQVIAVIAISCGLGFITTQFVEYVGGKFDKAGNIRGRIVTLVVLAVVPLILIFAQNPVSPETSPTPSESVTFNPTLSIAAEDVPEYLSDPRCTKNSTSCIYGNPKSDTHVILYGSSLSGNWQPALARIAEEEDWKLEVRINPDCPDEKQTKKCNEWLKSNRKYILGAKPNMVLSNFGVVGEMRIANYNQENSSSSGQIGEAANSEITTWSEFAKAGIRVVILRGSSAFNVDPVECLQKERDRRKCSFVKSNSYFDPAKIERIIAIAQYKFTLLDLTNKFCSQDLCFASNEKGLVVYRDKTHLTKTFSLSLSSLLKKELLAIMSKPIENLPSNCRINDQRPECSSTSLPEPQPSGSSESFGRNPK